MTELMDKCNDTSTMTELMDKCNDTSNTNNDTPTNKNNPEQNMYNSRRYRFDNVPDIFMSSNVWKTGMT